MRIVKIILLVYFWVGSSVYAQENLHLLMLEDAKEYYANSRYADCISTIEELERKGVKGPVTLHLKIMAASKSSPTALGYSRLVQFKKEVAFFLKEYDNEDFLDLYRDVYNVSKTLSDAKYNEQEVCYKAGFNAYSNQNYADAIQWYLKAAELGYGNSTMHYHLGNMYLQGMGTDKNYQQALKWLLKAATISHADAQNGVALIYFNGLGVKKDQSAGLEWLFKSFEQGNNNATAYLESIFVQGIEKVYPDKPKTAMYYCERVLKRQGIASTRLGQLANKSLSFIYDLIPEHYSSTDEDVNGFVREANRLAASIFSNKAPFAFSAKGIHMNYEVVEWEQFLTFVVDENSRTAGFDVFNNTGTATIHNKFKFSFSQNKLHHVVTLMEHLEGVFFVRK